MKIPVKPILPFSNLRIGKQGNGSVFLTKNSIALTSARAGIALALKQLGVGAGDKVLIPAFHCTAMIEPIVWLGVKPVFYRIEKDLSVKMNDLKSKYDSKVKAVIVIHYFGFPQNLKPIQSFCKKNSLYLIEDCAHAFWGENSDVSTGSAGDWAVASAMKFFPVMDGGYLYSSKHDFSNQKIQTPPFLANLKSAFNTIENATKYNRLQHVSKLLLLVFKFKDFLWEYKKKQPESTLKKNHLPSASFGGYSFEPEWMDKRMSLMSQLVINQACPYDIIKRRKANYNAILETILSLESVKPVFPTLPHHVVPYMIPILVDEPENILSRFVQLNVPFLRFGEKLWNGIDKSVCAVAHEYSKNGFQLPCHQDLTSEELSHINTQLRKLF